jgi:hypothetical protein
MGLLFSDISGETLFSDEIFPDVKSQDLKTAFKNVKKTTWSVKGMTEISFSLEINVLYLLVKF